MRISIYRWCEVKFVQLAPGEFFFVSVKVRAI